ncbi:MAG: hypothetical protein GTO29_14325 [Candidatus Latescibacteria bacterium]|nr:hypothetical protein [Candidatus Latescibacterota bacterium]NIO57322.1 hypothetical protein [Candidatus Latescibacterota bacterium]
MEGFTVTNGYSEAHGGAINWSASASPLTLNNCVFSANTGDNGSGINVGMSGGGTLVLADCDFVGNFSTAVHLLEVGEVQITNCNFIGNTGGICINETTNITISHCTFADNHAYYGGGILFGNDSAGLVTNCIFIGNVANWGEVSVATTLPPSLKVARSMRTELKTAEAVCGV